MKEFTIAVPTADGLMPAFMAIPDTSAVCPGVVVYMDVFGPRGELFDICRRFASCGYVAILPQLFYRLGSPVFPAIRLASDEVAPRAQEANNATTTDMTMRDIGAIIDFLDAGGAAVRVGRLGTVGYCMGGRHALAAAAAAPDAIAAAASIHGGRMVTEGEDSPHLLLSRVHSGYLAFARDDETCPEPHQQLLEKSAATAGPHIACERLNAHHGWSFPERWCFDRAASEHVWERVLALFRRTLWTPHEALRRD